MLSGAELRQTSSRRKRILPHQEGFPRVTDFVKMHRITVGLISPDQDLCIAQGYNVDCNPQPSHVC